MEWARKHQFNVLKIPMQPKTSKHLQTGRKTPGRILWPCTRLQVTKTILLICCGQPKNHDPAHADTAIRSYGD